MSFITKQKEVNALIPDNNAEGLVDSIRVFRQGNIEKMQVRVNITHSFNGDLEVHLQSPSGKKIQLHSRSRKPGKDLNMTFEGDALKDMVGEKASGNWKLRVVDFAPQDSGYLNNWTLHMDLTNKGDSEIFIPEDEKKTLVSKQMCTLVGNVQDINAKIDIQHTYIGDLKIALESPSGKSVLLHNRKGGGKNDLVKSFDKDALKEFIGEKAKGVWTLKAKDYAKADSGRIRKWSIDMKIK